MAVIWSWKELADLRGQGLAPSRRMFVTTNRFFARQMTWVGCAAIVHKAGEPMPVELLHGLDVILDVGACDRASSVWRLMKQRNVIPSRLQVWCACDRMLTVAPRECSSGVDDYLTCENVSHVA